ncbi:MAG: magnesium transporter [Phenylobacterium sp.]|nr:magnesium transporter [Phenylobacterium sp.]MDB5494665.1 magnesium transporter [Phenylobacterium sp.]
MTVVSAYVYRKGQRVREAPLTEAGLALRPGEFVWIGLHDPDEAELRLLARKFKLHPLAVEDALAAHQLPKVEVYGHELFVVARTAELAGDRIRYGETHVFMGKSYVVSVRHGSARAHTALRAHLEAAPALLSHGPDYVVHGILDFIVDGYMPIVEEIEEAVLTIETRALDAFLARADVRRIFLLRSELLRFRRILGPMEEVASKLEHLNLPGLDADVRPYFRDVADHVRRVAGRVEGLRDVLSSVFEVSTLLEQQRQGIITRKLAAWAAILAVPTAIAGIYGMNFEFMPELHWRLGYPLTLVMIAGICGVLFAAFRRSGWL